MKEGGRVYEYSKKWTMIGRERGESRGKGEIIENIRWQASGV
jgi:hypothetical protein